MERIQNLKSFVVLLFVGSTHRGVNSRPKDVTQTQQQKPEVPTVTLTWHACKYRVWLHLCDVF